MLKINVQNQVVWPRLKTGSCCTSIFRCHSCEKLQKHNKIFLRHVPPAGNYKGKMSYCITRFGGHTPHSLLPDNEAQINIDNPWNIPAKYSVCTYIFFHAKRVFSNIQLNFCKTFYKELKHHCVSLFVVRLDVTKKVKCNGLWHTTSLYIAMQILLFLRRSYPTYLDVRLAGRKRKHDWSWFRFTDSDVLSGIEMN